MSDVFMKFQELFDHMIDEHNVTLLESEMREIIRICQKIENNDSQKSSVIDGIISESGKGKPSRLGNVEAIETDEGMIVVESKRTAVCDKINMKCNNIQTACSVCYTDYLHYKSKAD